MGKLFIFLLGVGVFSVSAVSNAARNTDQKLVVQFEDSAIKRKTMDRQLKELTSGHIRVADAKSFQKKDSPCADHICAIVDKKELGELQKLGEKIPAFKIIGMKTVERFSFLKNEDPARAYISSGAFSVVNPDPVINYIPNLGFQDLGIDLPASAAAMVTPVSAITSVSYLVHLYHTAPVDLVISIGYDDTLMGGASIYSEPIATHSTSIPVGSSTLSGTAVAFNQFFNPNSHYYIHASDTVGSGSGYLESAEFEVFWSDDPDLEMYIGAGASFFWNQTQPLLSQGYIDVDATISNESLKDITTPFSVGWYITPGNSCGAWVNADPTDANAYYVGSQTSTGINGYQVQYLSLIGADATLATNPAGNHPVGGMNYCLWSYADNTQVVSEVHEDNNAYKAYGTFFLSLVTDVQEARKSGLQMTVYPNPTVESLNIALPETMKGIGAQMDIVGVSGQIIRSENISGNEGPIHTNVSDLSPGIYFVKIKSADDEFVNRFVKQ